jgi:uncharacterized protein Yka (UPF0111/DUF47 family)
MDEVKEKLLIDSLMENLEKQKEIDEYISKIKRLEKENDKL